MFFGPGPLKAGRRSIFSATPTVFQPHPWVPSPRRGLAAAVWSLPPLPAPCARRLRRRTSLRLGGRRSASALREGTTAGPAASTARRAATRKWNMTNIDRFRLLGRYRTPRFRYGRTVRCEVRGEVEALPPYPARRRQKSQTPRVSSPHDNLAPQMLQTAGVDFPPQGPERAPPADRRLKYVRLAHAPNPSPPTKHSSEKVRARLRERSSEATWSL
jgi:hypothetical protein